ncbi:MAG: hypothetical protein OEN02_16160, partial [Gammaproteobacteria bacterium]|nr:hypothetical protein [Gammaproteobacteria bacterium]
AACRRYPPSDNRPGGVDIERSRPVGFRGRLLPAAAPAVAGWRQNRLVEPGILIVIAIEFNLPNLLVPVYGTTND